MRRPLSVALLCVAAGCGAPPETTNPCATRGASYLESFAEQSGNCGPLPSQVVNIAPDGSVPTGGTNITCESTNQSGCTTQRSNCAWTGSGNSYNATSTLTFTQDGSKASGLFTVSVSGNSSCMETYAVTWTRQ